MSLTHSIYTSSDFQGHALCVLYECGEFGDQSDFMNYIFPSLCVHTPAFVLVQWKSLSFQ